jgi:hypothetical protein
MVIKYTKIFHRKTPQNLPKLVIFGLKTNHPATLVCSSFTSAINVADSTAGRIFMTSRKIGFIYFGRYVCGSLAII